MLGGFFTQALINTQVSITITLRLAEVIATW